MQIKDLWGINRRRDFQRKPIPTGLACQGERRKPCKFLTNFLVNTKRNIDLRDLEDQNH